jgi:hypothetical protein
MQKIPIGTATAAGLSTSAGAYALAIAAYLSGDRSEGTIGALGVGTAALLTVLAGRFAQAVAHIVKAPTAAPAPAYVQTPSAAAGTGTFVRMSPASRVTISEAPRPAVDIENGDPPPLNVPGRSPTG